MCVQEPPLIFGGWLMIDSDCKPDAIGHLAMDVIGRGPGRANSSRPCLRSEYQLPVDPLMLARWAD